MVIYYDVMLLFVYIACIPWLLYAYRSLFKVIGPSGFKIMHFIATPTYLAVPCCLLYIAWYLTLQKEAELKKLAELMELLS